jgi:hypothetical protein
LLFLGYHLLEEKDLTGAELESRPVKTRKKQRWGEDSGRRLFLVRIRRACRRRSLNYLPGWRLLSLPVRSARLLTMGKIGICHLVAQVGQLCLPEGGGDVACAFLRQVSIPIHYPYKLRDLPQIDTPLESEPLDAVAEKDKGDAALLGRLREKKFPMPEQTIRLDVKE